MTVCPNGTIRCVARYPSIWVGEWEGDTALALNCHQVTSHYKSYEKAWHHMSHFIQLNPGPADLFSYGSIIKGLVKRQTQKYLPGPHRLANTIRHCDSAYWRQGGWITFHSQIIYLMIMNNYRKVIITPRLPSACHGVPSWALSLSLSLAQGSESEPGISAIRGLYIARPLLMRQGGTRSSTPWQW